WDPYVEFLRRRYFQLDNNWTKWRQRKWTIPGVARCIVSHGFILWQCLERTDGYVQLGAEREHVDPSSERRWLPGPQIRSDDSSFNQARLVIRREDRETSLLALSLSLESQRDFLRHSTTVQGRAGNRSLAGPYSWANPPAFGSHALIVTARLITVH